MQKIPSSKWLFVVYYYFFIATSEAHVGIFLIKRFITTALTCRYFFYTEEYMQLFYESPHLMKMGQMRIKLRQKNIGNLSCIALFGGKVWKGKGILCCDKVNIAAYSREVFKVHFFQLVSCIFLGMCFFSHDLWAWKKRPWLPFCTFCEINFIMDCETNIARTKVL